MQARTGRSEALRRDQPGRGAQAGRRKERQAAADDLGDDVDLDLVERAALHEGHLQFAAAQHPDIAVVQRAQFPDQRVDVRAGLERAVRVDPDLWIVEIEDREGRHFLTEPVEAG